MQPCSWPRVRPRTMQHNVTMSSITPCKTSHIFYPTLKAQKEHCTVYPTHTAHALTLITCTSASAVQAGPLRAHNQAGRIAACAPRSTARPSNNQQFPATGSSAGARVHDAQPRTNQARLTCTAADAMRVRARMCVPMPHALACVRLRWRARAGGPPSSFCRPDPRQWPAALLCMCSCAMPARAGDVGTGAER